MLLIETTYLSFNAEEIKRGTLIWAKHKTWEEGHAGIVSEVSEKMIKVQFLPHAMDTTNHFFIIASEVFYGRWEIRYSNDDLQTVKCYPEEENNESEPVN